MMQRMLFVTVMMGFGSLCAKAPNQYYNNRESSRYEQTVSYSDLEHSIENHEIELRTVDERLSTQETIIDTLRQQLLDANFANKEMFKGNTISLEKKVSNIDTGLLQMTADMKDLQSHANETAKVLSQYKQKIGELEKQLLGLRSAMDSILIALQVEEPPQNKADVRIYEVKAGDSLEKIARRSKTSIKKLKELNGLEKDRIYTGQKLKLP